MGPLVLCPTSRASPAPMPFLCHPRSSIQTYFHSEGSLAKKSHACRWIRKILGKSRRRRMTINVLPDDVLLQIFHWCLNEDPSYPNPEELEEWQTLVHVCRKWRNVVLESPRRLNLRLLCDGRRPVREMLDVWPSFPIVIYVSMPEAVQNVIAAFEHSDRVSQVLLDDISSSDLKNVLAVIQETFPALRHLQIQSEYDVQSPVVSDSFLGGSAPHLQYLELTCVPFPGLPKLLLSATHLVTLYLWHIPHSGYFPPDAIIAPLSASTRLETFWLQFQSPRSRPDRERRLPPPLTRSVLLALTHFTFEGVSEYLEDLVARIDAPLFGGLDIRFFHQLIFDTPQLTQFISRTPDLSACLGAHVSFHLYAAKITLSSQEESHKTFELRISCTHSDWQLSSLAQICSSFFPVISSLEYLYIKDEYLELNSPDDIENAQWLELLHPFTAVKSLHISPKYAPHIAPALQELVGERAAEVLPALLNLFLEGPNTSRAAQEAIEKFEASRRLSGHPITVSY